MGDAFIEACDVEIFSQGEEISQYGSVSSELLLLVDGKVDLLMINDGNSKSNNLNTNSDHSMNSFKDAERMYENSLVGTEITEVTSTKLIKRLGSGDFINEIGFFTEIIQTFSISTASKCKMIVLPRSKYKSLSRDYPDSIEKLLRNLLAK